MLPCKKNEGTSHIEGNSLCLPPYTDCIIIVKQHWPTADYVFGLERCSEQTVSIVQIMAIFSLGCSSLGFSGFWNSRRISDHLLRKIWIDSLALLCGLSASIFCAHI